MGLRGPVPEPTAIKEAKGNPGRRALNENEPVPPPDPVRPPAWLTTEALAIWNDLAPTLIQMRVLTVVDRMAFGRYCRMMARYIELQQQMWDKGPQGTLYPLKDKKGKVRNAAEWPMAAELRRLQELLVRLEDRFGLTPASRSRIRVMPLYETATVAPADAATHATGGPYKLMDYTRAGGPKGPRKPASK